MSATAAERAARDTVRFQHRVEFAAFRAVLAGSERLTDARAAALGAALGGLGWRLGIKRAVVMQNLRIAFPDATQDRIDEIARASYEHLGRETMMMLRLASMPREELIERTRTVNEEEADAAWREGRGCVVVAGHLGNWEIGAAMMTARGYPIDVIAKRSANPLFYQRILAARERLGVHVIDFQGAPRHTIRSLRQGRAVAFAADQHAGRAGLWVPFFGRPASTYRGPALLALRTGAPVYLSIPLRMPDGTYELTLERISAEHTGDMDTDVLRLTEAYALRLEAAVRANPEQYLWQHRRWRTPPVAGTVPESGTTEEPDGGAEV